MAILLNTLFKNQNISELSSKYKHAGFEAFKSWLSKEDKEELNISALKQLFGSIDNINPNNLSTFFYHTMFTLQNESLQAEKIFFLFLFAIDSLFEYLPENISFLINPTFTGTIYLPNLDQSITCKKLTAMSIKFNNNNFILNEVNLFLIKPKKILHKNLKFVIAHTAGDDLLCEKLIIQSTKYEKIVDGDVEQFTEKLIKAINLILFVDDSFKNLLAKIEFIIPMSFVSNDITKSFTLSGLPHILFLSDANSYLKIMENLIHESFHDELNVFMKFYTLYYDYGELYYSPWRNDPRPIRGLMHAIYVFTGIYQYYFNFLTNHLELLGAEEKKHVLFRYNLIHYELELSFLQLRNEDKELTCLGKEFIQILYSIYTECKSEYVEAHCPPSILSHLNKWRRSNKTNKMVLTDRYVTE